MTLNSTHAFIPHSHTWPFDLCSKVSPAVIGNVRIQNKKTVVS